VTTQVRRIIFESYLISEEMRNVAREECSDKTDPPGTDPKDLHGEG
jgi:hypothetical protein